VNLIYGRVDRKLGNGPVFPAERMHHIVPHRVRARSQNLVYVARYEYPSALLNFSFQLSLLPPGISQIEAQERFIGCHNVGIGLYGLLTAAPVEIF